MIHRTCSHPWESAVEPFCIAGNLYYVGNKDVSAHLIDTGDGLILIDSTFPQTVYLLLESIRKLGFDPQDLAYIIHSHAHYDHSGGTQALVELTGAKTAVGKGDLRMLTDRQSLIWAKEYGVMYYEQFHVDIALTDQDTLKLGDTTIRCIHSPGHTDGTMSFLFNVKNGDTTYTAGMHGGPGWNTLTDEYLSENNRSEQNRKEFRESARRLLEFDVDIHLGIHPPQNDLFNRLAEKTEEHNPFINKESWPAFLNQHLA